ncbi:MAG: 3-oxoacyl-[Clostridia bacterium]|nr:3-oxoacyl-[acyl-carrier-protein] reductase [Clostridia bacterium]
MNDKILENKTAIITGGSRGIGRAIALKFAEVGANVAIIYCGSADAAEETRKTAETFGVKSLTYKCNIASFDECKDTVDKIIEDFGGFDILVNNAGITRDKLILKMDESDFDEVIDVNLKGAFNMIKHCCKTLTKRRYGKIINISSVAGITGNAGQINYSASKAGIIGMTKTVAKELSGRNICCNAIAPGFIETDMTDAFKDNEAIISSIPLKRIGNPEEVANLAAFLASSSSDYITGEVIRIDGGLAI